MMKKIFTLFLLLMSAVCVAQAKDTWTVAGISAALNGTDDWAPTNTHNDMTSANGEDYTLTVTDCTLRAGMVYKYKVVKDHDWAEAYPTDNKTFTVSESAIYTVTYHFNATSHAVSEALTKTGTAIVGGEGWPANYGGVLLQAFYWDSFEDTNLNKLKNQADELSTYFDLIWLPCTGAAGSTDMGYLPIYWFNNNSNFGSQDTLKELIKTLNAKGTKVIMDVVLNHKASKGENGSWVDFPNETWTHDGITEELQWTTADICRNDDGGYTNTVGASDEMKARNGGWECTGADDTGDDFSGGRDLDHTSANVQKNCITYLNYLQKELGYSGFRLDMVKGYSPYFNKLYNEATLPEFCVGEFWDGKERITDWIVGTGYTSAAFDFPFKYQVKKAFGDGDWDEFNRYKGICEDSYWQRYAVTFIDNHDTYRNDGRLATNVLGANAFMLAMPGTPCVFLKHWQRYPIAIGNMILARKACGINSQSPIVEAHTADGGFVLKVQGTKGTVLCIGGYVNMDTTGFKLIANGQNFAFFVSDNITVEGLREGSDEEEVRDVTVFVEAEQAPCLYAWAATEQPINGSWPGTRMSTTRKTADGRTFWTHTFGKVPVNIVINSGADNGVQTANITNITHDSYFTFDQTNNDKESNWTDITWWYYTPEPLPACAKPINGHLYCYFLGNKDYDSPRAWAWVGEKGFCGDWPGAAMTRVGDDGQGHPVWLWDAGSLNDLFHTHTPALSLLPQGILFNNNGNPKTGDFKFEIGGYYDVNGLRANVTKDRKGDLNGDGKVDVADIMEIIGIAAKEK